MKSWFYGYFWKDVVTFSSLRRGGALRRQLCPPSCCPSGGLEARLSRRLRGNRGRKAGQTWRATSGIKAGFRWKQVSVVFLFSLFDICSLIMEDLCTDCFMFASLWASLRIPAPAPPHLSSNRGQHGGRTPFKAFYLIKSRLLQEAWAVWVNACHACAAGGALIRTHIFIFRRLCGAGRCLQRPTRYRSILFQHPPSTIISD